MKRTTNIQSLKEKDIINVSINNRGVDSLGEDFVIYQKTNINILLNELRKAKQVENARTNISKGALSVSILEIKNKIEFSIIETSLDGVIIRYEDELWKTHYYRNDSIPDILKQLVKR